MTTGLVAGDALDVLVAEKVMGWKVGRAYEDGPEDDRWYTPQGEKLGWDHATPKGHGGGDYDYPDEAWSPSTDIRAAMEVADKVGDMMLRKNATRDTSGDTDWGCYFELLRNRLRDEEPVACTEERRRLGLPFGTPYIYADTAPLAICRAALAAIGEV